MRAHRQELAFCKLGCLHDHPAIYTQGIVVVQAAYVFPFDLKRHHHIGASLARRRSEGALDIELRHKPEQLFRLSLHNALALCVFNMVHYSLVQPLYGESSLLLSGTECTCCPFQGSSDKSTKLWVLCNTRNERGPGLALLRQKPTVKYEMSAS